MYLFSDYITICKIWCFCCAVHWKKNSLYEIILSIFSSVLCILRIHRWILEIYCCFKGKESTLENCYHVIKWISNLPAVDLNPTDYICFTTATKTDIFECLIGLVLCFMANMDVNTTCTCTIWNQILRYDIRVPVLVVLGGVEVIRVHHGRNSSCSVTLRKKKKHFLYKQHIINISATHLILIQCDTWAFILRRKQEVTAPL